MAAILLPTTPFSQRAKPTPLWWRTSLKRCTRRGTTRISRVRCGKATRRCASCVPPLARRNGAPHERGAGGESDPPFLAAGAPRGRAKVAAKVAALCPPCGEVALTTVIPAGRPLRQPRGVAGDNEAGQGRNLRPQLKNWPRPTRLEGGATKDFQVAARAACHSTWQTRTPGLGVNTRLTCPPTSWRV